MFPTTRFLVTKSGFHNKLILGCNSPAPFLPHMQVTQQEEPKSPSHPLPVTQTITPPPQTRQGGFRQLPPVTLGWDGALQHQPALRREAAPGHRETQQEFGESSPAPAHTPPLLQRSANRGARPVPPGHPALTIPQSCLVRLRGVLHCAVATCSRVNPAPLLGG